MYSYVSWIPTVAGRLSFRQIGKSNFPSKTSCENAFFEDQKGSRFIVGFQKRNLSDAFFQIITHRISKIEGKYAVFFCCKNESQDESLCGAIYFINKSRDDIRDEWKNLRYSEGISYIKSRIINLRENLTINNIEESKTIYADCDSYLKYVADFFVHFQLDRTGIIFLSDASSFNKEGFTLHVDSNNVRKWIVDQAYFCIRDISHSHQHHDNSTDTILITQSLSIGEQEWRNNIIYSLYFHTISLKRKRNYEKLAQAEGVLAYASAFMGICQNQGYTIPDYQTEALLRSLSAKMKQHEALHAAATQRIASFTLFLTYVLPSIAIIYTILGPILNRINIANDHWVYKYIENIYYNAVGYTIEIILIPPIFLVLLYFLNTRRATKSYKMILYFISNIAKNKYIIQLIAFIGIIISIIFLVLFLKY